MASRSISGSQIRAKAKEAGQEVQYGKGKNWEMDKILYGRPGQAWSDPYRLHAEERHNRQMCFVSMWT